jgi:signal transduction histidine kinase
MKAARPLSIETRIKVILTAIAIGLTGLTVGTALTQGLLERTGEARLLLETARSAAGGLSATQVEPLLERLSPFWKEAPPGLPAETVRSTDGKEWRFTLDRSRIWNALVYRQRYVLVAGLIGLLVAVELAVFLAYGLTRPMKVLAWGCEQMRSGRWVRLPTLSRTPYELEALNEAFNGMVEDLERWQDFQKQAARVERLAALGSVAAAVAHEVKNPLASMRIHLDLLKGRLPAGEKESVAILGTELDRLNQTVSQLLSYARPRPPLFGPVDARELLGWIASMTDTPCRLAGVQQSWSVEEGCPPLWGDGPQLKQVMLNLVLNAVGAQPNGGTVCLVARREGLNVAIKVSDTGPGIPPELLERVFDPFFTTRPEGTGLGLSIVHRIVEGHGGRVSVETSELGTVFTLVLPTEPPGKKES